MSINTNEKIIPLHLFPLGVIEAFEQRHVSRSKLLHGTGIDDRLLSRPDKEKISYKQLIRLLINGVITTREAGFALSFLHNLAWGFLGPVEGLVCCCPSLQDALFATVRYQVVALPHIAAFSRRCLFVTNKNQQVIVLINPVLLVDQAWYLQRFEIESYLAFIMRLVGAVELCPVKAELKIFVTFSRPSYHRLYEILCRGNITYNAEFNGISINQDYFEKPIRPYRIHNYNRLINQCERELLDVNPEQAFSDYLKWQLAKQVQSGQTATLATIAKHLHLSPRVIRNRLAREGNNFRQLLNSVRRDTVLSYQKYSDLDANQLAEFFGFEEVSSYYRALKRWRI